MKDQAGWSTLLRSLLGGPSAASPAAVEELPEVAVQPIQPAVGERLGGRYRLDEELGSGAAAAVYRARDEVLDLDVAVKVLLLDGLFRSDEAAEAQASLRAEARASLRLTHPNIVRVHTYAADGAWEYLVMEYVPGPSLLRWRNGFPERRAPVERVLEVGVALADALDHAHAVGVVHNDVKPGNVVMWGEQPKLCDFGLARLAERNEGTGRLVSGSPVYMAPERLRGAPGDARGDQYSLAATLYCLLVGSAPFGGDQSVAIRGHLKGQLPTDDHVPAALDRVLRRAMAKKPDDRFPSAKAFGEALAAELAARRAELASPIEVGSATPASRERVVLEPGQGLRVAAVPVEAAPTPVTLPRAVVPPAVRTPPPRVPTPPDGTVFVSDRRVQVGGKLQPIPAFFAEVTPVTNASYRAFVEATGHPAPAHWIGSRPPRGKDRHPVVGVTRDDARAYAAWAGRRLPTEAEWSALLRGPDGDRPFPFGPACLDGRACACPKAGAEGTAEVGGRPAGATPEGIQDLLGNVWEWVEAPGDEGLALGASYHHACTRPGEIPRSVLAPGKSLSTVGFRCVADLREAA